CCLRRALRCLGCGFRCCGCLSRSLLRLLGCRQVGRLGRLRSCCRCRLGFLGLGLSFLRLGLGFLRLGLGRLGCRLVLSRSSRCLLGRLLGFLGLGLGRLSGCLGFLGSLLGLSRCLGRLRRLGCRTCRQSGILRCLLRLLGCRQVRRL